jgi:hypothetical protein
MELENEKSSVNLLKYGCKEHPLIFYTELGKIFNEMDHLDRLRVIDIFLKNLFNVDITLHPVVMRLMMEKLQDIEIKSAGWKKMLGDNKIEGLKCQKCNCVYPTMTLEQLCCGVNAECPHDSIEVKFDESG